MTMTHVTMIKREGDVIVVRCACGWRYVTRGAEEAMTVGYEHEETS